ncbi:hypothetical protein BLOT_015230, partial [Blomia tropicalis]
MFNNTFKFDFDFTMSANSDCNKNSILIEPYRLDDLYSVNGFFVRYLWKDLFLSKAQKEGFIVEEKKDFFNLSIIIDEMQKCWKALRVGRRPKFFRTFYVGNDEINKWGNGYGNGYDYI